MVGLTKVEELIVKQAFLNAVGEDLKTKNPDNLRGQVDQMMRDAYESNPMAGRSYDLRLLGQKVGTYSLTVSKDEPSREEMTLEINDRAEFMEWAEENGYVEKVVDMDAVISDMRNNGVVPDGCTPAKVIVPGTVGGMVTRTTVKVDEEHVMRVLGPQLETVAYALLGGGDDGL